MYEMTRGSERKCFDTCVCMIYVVDQEGEMFGNDGVQ
jgi:hypothetical protein